MNKRDQLVQDLIHSLGNSSNSSFNSSLLSQLFTLFNGFDIGWANYNHSDTNPVAIAADTWIKVPNDKGGSLTDESFIPRGNVTWMDSSGSIILSDMEHGSLVFWRYDISVTTTSNNDTVQVRSSWGNLHPFTLTAANPMQIKNAGTFSLSGFTGGWVGSDDVRFNPVDMEVYSELGASFVNNGSFMLGFVS